MSKAEMLRAFVNQRLSLAAAEIFEQFERTIAEYEEELESRSKENQRQHELLDALSNPEVRSHTAVSPDVQQLLEVKEEVPSEQQEWSSSLDQEDPELPHIKEEQEELWISQEGEQLRGLEEAENKFTSVPVKSEDDEERARSSQLHERQTEENREAERTDADGEDWGGPEPQSPLQPEYSSEPETDDSGDWEVTEEPQSGCARSSGEKGHVKKHTGIYTGGKPFSCSVCGKRFTLKKSLTAHMRLHSGGKCFTCSVCKAGFANRSILISHIRTHTGEKPFGCSYCSKSFAQAATLKQHLTVHTGEKTFTCSVCTQRFADHTSLRRHFTLHTGEKPFSCSVCSKTFRHSSNLSRHMSVHTGEKPFRCTMCDKSFADHSNMRRHVVRYHTPAGKK